MSFPAENCKPSFRAPVSLNSKPLTQPSFTEQKNPYTSFPAENGMHIYVQLQKVISGDSLWCNSASRHFRNKFIGV
jgi:hypothetical protein